MTHPQSDASSASEPSTADRTAWITGEPAMPELFDDPLIHAVLRRDGLSLADLQRAIALARHRLTAANRHHEKPASDAA